MIPRHSSLAPALAAALIVAPFAAFAAGETVTVTVPDARPAPIAPKDPTAAWFFTRLGGEAAAAPAAAPLAAREVDGARAALWAKYKEAAIARGWDRDLVAPVEMPANPKDPKKLPKIKPGAIVSGEEVMPYFYFSRGTAPANGRPLFFQTHGGGSTDEKLPHPHAWSVNTRDWQAQLGVCMRALPEGLYFVPRMANDNKGRWWMKHNHAAFDKLIRRAVLFNGVDPDRIYMMGISEGAYGTETLTPYWADRFAGGCAMAGGAGGGERLYNLRNTAFRNDTGEHDTMFKRIELAQQVHEYLDNLKKADPTGYDHMIHIHPGMGHGINYQPGPAWIATKVRNNRPAKVCWFNFAVDGERRSEFSWLSLGKAPERDTLIVAEADRATNTVTVSARITPPEIKDESPVHNQSTPPPVANRLPYTGNALTIHLDDKLLDLDKPVTVLVNGKQAFAGRVERRVEAMADDIARHGDPGRVFPGRVTIQL